MNQPIDGKRGREVDLFDHLFSNYQRLLFAYIFGQMGDRQAAEDVLQQVFIKVWRHIGKAREKSDEALRNWLFSIAKNAVIDARRQRLPKLFALDEHLPDTRQEVHSQAEDSEALEKISRVVQLLPEETRVAFTMSVLGDMSSDEIGIVLGKPAGTIRYLVSEARKRIMMEIER